MTRKNWFVRFALIGVLSMTLPAIAMAKDHGHHNGGNGGGGGGGGDNEGAATFSTSSFQGRYVAVSNENDSSTLHDASETGGGNISPTVPFVGTGVMISDGAGSVCGESDGFYPGVPSAPGVDLGPSFFQGNYVIDAGGRILINTCSVTAASLVAACASPQPVCNGPGGTNHPTPGDVNDTNNNLRIQAGYLRSFNADVLTTVGQITTSNTVTSGFILVGRRWERARHGNNGDD